MSTTSSDELVTGIVEHAGLYESAVGLRDRCIVFLRVGDDSRQFTFDADVRDRLPVGRRVQLRYRPSRNDDPVTLLDRKLL